jgi:hypothetical protein
MGTASRTRKGNHAAAGLADRFHFWTVGFHGAEEECLRSRVRNSPLCEKQIVITPEKRSFRIRLKQEHAKATAAQ